MSRATRQVTKRSNRSATLGTRVRALRVARGMSQADLAGTDFSKGFIGLLETGRTGVSLRAAEILARRLGVSVTEVLSIDSRADADIELLLTRAEAELSAGRAHAALELADALRGRASGSARGRIDRLRGRAALAAGRPSDAVEFLRESVRALRAAKAVDLAVRATFDLAVAHARLDQVTDALHLGLECERAFLAAEIVDRTLELQVLAFLAAAFVRVSDFSSADERSARAAKLAEDVVEARTLASLYASLAITRQEQSDLEAALRYARRSLDAYEELGARKAVGSSWNTIGWVYVERRQFEQASAALKNAAAIADAEADGALAAVVLQTRAELALARADATEARRLAEESAAHPDASPRARAGSLLVRAQAMAASDVALPEVNAAFADALSALAPEGARALARAYEAHFDALSARGEHAAAVGAAQRMHEQLRPRLA